MHLAFSDNYSFIEVKQIVLYILKNRICRAYDFCLYEIKI